MIEKRLSRGAWIAALLSACAAASIGATAGDATTRTVTEAEAKNWRPSLNRAEEWADGRTGRVSISVVDMRKRHAHDDSNNKANTASTIKVMLMAAYLRQDSVRDRALNSYDRSLIQPMIQRSDNKAASRIHSMLGRGPLERLAKKAGMRSFEWNAAWGLSQTTARDQAYFMRALKQYIPPRHWNFARKQLARITPSQRWGIGQVDLNGWRLYFKGGWTSTVNHQIVLLTKDDQRIGLAVFTEGSPSQAYAHETLEGTFQRLLRDLPG